MPAIQLLSPGPRSSSAECRSKPHVLLVVDGFPKALGGGERIVLRLAALLPRYGFRASILTFALAPESSFRPEDAPCPLYLLPLTNTYGPGAWRGALALQSLLREQQVSIVQTFFESSDLWAGTMTRLLSSARLIWSRRDMGILRGSKHTVAYRALRHLPHAVVAVSAKVAEHAINVDGVPPERVHVVHNGLDLAPNIHAIAIPPSEPVFVTTVGNIRRVKGHDLLVQAAAEVISRHPEVKFTVAGEVLEPDYFRELQDSVVKLGITGSFNFVGKVHDLAGHLSLARVFVLPSRSEGFSNALIEAMSMGLACIATDVGGNADAIKDGHSGLLLPPENASALADALLRLLDEPDFAQRLSRNARDTVAQKFTVDAMMHKITSLYAQLLQ